MTEDYDLSLAARLRAQATFTEDVNYGRPSDVMREAADFVDRNMNHGPRMTWANEGEPTREGRTCTCGLAWPHPDVPSVEAVARAIQSARLPSGGYALLNDVQAEVVARAALAAMGIEVSDV